jgi:nucleotide-binding universal stress UspA family protein
MSRIVVGVDDSVGGRAALAWALDEARLRGARLEVTHSLSSPWSEGFNREWPSDEAWFVEQAKKLLEELVAEVDTEGIAVKPVTVIVRAEGPGFGLIDRAAGADLLVVGSRGRGGFTGLLLGSVSTQCVHHAPCPVVVVPAPHDR